jgi:tRNA C32,U32 (ribose-2'-O)-methylase TrmJ
MIENIRTIFHKMNLSDKEMRILLGIIGSLKDKKVD